MRQRIFELVNTAREGDYASRAYDIYIVTVAIISLTPMLFDTQTIPAWAQTTLYLVDVVTSYLLIFDYMCRWMTHDMKTGNGWKSFIYYPFTPMAIIDLLGILPVLSFIPQSLKFLRILRIVKVFRYSRHLVVVTNACARESKTLLSVFLAVVVYTLSVAMVVYTCEPESFIDFFDAIGWAVCQLTSVSYSDSRPTGYLAEGLSMVSALAALVIVALPAGVITGAYLKELEVSRRNESRYFRMVNFNRKDADKSANRRIITHNKTKVKRYAVIMAASFVLSAAISYLAELFSWPLWFDEVGVALSAFLLEPAAGLVVAFLTTALTTINAGDTISALYVIPYSLTAIAFGIVFPRQDSDHKILRVIVVLLIMTFGAGAIEDVIETMLVEAGTGWYASYATYLAAASSGVFGFAGLPADWQIVARPMEAVILIAVFALFVKTLGMKAMPSLKEQQEERAAKQEQAMQEQNLQDKQVRANMRRTLTDQLYELADQQLDLVQKIEEINERLDEINAIDREETEKEKGRTAASASRNSNGAAAE